MWFEMLLCCCTGLLLLDTQHQQTADKMGNRHRLVWVFAPACFMLLFHRTYSVKEMLAGCVVIVCILCSCHFRKCLLTSKLEQLPYVLQILTVSILGLFVLNHYQPAAESDDMTYEKAVVLFICISILLLLSKKVERKLQNKVRGIHVLWLAIAAPVWGFYMIELAYNTDLEHMEWKYCAGNVLWLACLMLILYGLFYKKKAAIGLFLTGCFVFGVANYYVGKFRGSPIMPSDLQSVGTAFQVAGGYEFEVSGQIIASALCWYASMALLCCLPATECVHTGKIQIVAASLAICLGAGTLYFIDPQQRYGWEMGQWDVGYSYREVGSVWGFTALLKNMQVTMPEHYSEKRVEEIYQNNKLSGRVRKGQEPTVIAIMDETFSDLRTLGAFDCSQEYLKHWYAVDDYACKGTLYVSVYGGNTANTEFEFLTGNSMGNCPVGIVPYQSYSMKNIGNLAGILDDAGYQTIAIHPEYKGNWNRMRVYQNFGFQTFLGIDDFAEPVYIRDHVSDQSSFDKVIQLFENNRQKKQFIFNVTMQNHGGYNLQDLAGMDTVTLKGQQEDYPDVETYLTLMRESDRAISQLLQYFREVEEPVILCIFGDHLPGLNETWVEHVMGKARGRLSLEELEKKYAVPYMIWANFDTPYQRQELDTSANYLGALLLENAGLTQTAYTNFLLQMRKQIPIINAFGYMAKDGDWHSFEEETAVSSWIEDYRILQYHAMFDSQSFAGTGGRK